MNISLFRLVIFLCFAIALSLANTVNAYQTETNTKRKKCGQRFTFSWSLHKECNEKPRGGTSRGAKVNLDSNPHDGWLAIQELGLDKFEQDRRAILAMAGPYRTSFDFLEIVGYTEAFKPDKPYQSWGTEYVYVVEDRGDFISVQHIMVMFFETEQGISQPIVMKHWRQDWQYEKRQVLSYKGHSTWQQQKLNRKQRQGTWSQAVYQVDDSPRYESYGTWQHKANFSTWESGLTWRPLPRREYSVRDDYQVLEGFNRHTILPNGWVHEQDNYKLVLNEDSQPDEKTPYLAKEIGLNRYEKIIGHDFSAGDNYWNNTGIYWQDVRDIWALIIKQKNPIKLHKKVDGEPLFIPLFQYAESVNITEYDREKARHFILQTITKYLNNN